MEGIKNKFMSAKGVWSTVNVKPRKTQRLKCPKGWRVGGGQNFLTLSLTCDSVVVVVSVRTLPPPGLDSGAVPAVHHGASWLLRHNVIYRHRAYPPLVPHFT